MKDRSVKPRFLPGVENGHAVGHTGRVTHRSTTTRNTALDTRYVLYWAPMSGAIVVEMLLHELGIDFHRQVVDMADGEHRREAYRRLNPGGQVPALRLPDGRVIGESAAIVLTIGEQHPGSPMVPGSADADRPAFLHWLCYMAASTYMAFVRAGHPERFTIDAAGTDAVRAAALGAVEQQFDVINRVLAGETFLARGLSALDLYLAMLTVWHPDRDDLFRRLPRLGTLVRAVQRRPSCGAVLDEHLAHA